MLVELLSTSNYVSFNIRLAQIIGLHEAIYVSELMNINDKALRKNKIDGNYFSIDREYLTKRTTFQEAEQKDIEQNLLKLGILEKSSSNDNTLYLNLTTLTSIMMSSDENLVKDISKIAKQKREKRSKTDVIKDNLKNNILTNDPELRKAYSDWIDSVYAKQGWMSAKAVQAGQTLLDDFTLVDDNKHDLDLALKILEIASISGYRDLQWAINNYKDNYNVSYKIKNTKKVDVDKKIELSKEAY